MAVRNVANEPPQFNVDRLSFLVEDRFAESGPVSAVIPRATRITRIPGSGFRQDAVANFMGRPSIKYGHPEYKYSWISEKRLNY